MFWQGGDGMISQFSATPDRTATSRRRRTRNPRYDLPVLRHLVYALRQISRAPAFAIAAVLTLALGTGANAAIFGLIDGFLRPLPVPNPDRIVVLAAESPGDETGFRYRFSFQAMSDLRKQTDTFADVFGFDSRLGGMGVDGKTAQFIYQVVTGHFFSGLGLQPAAGQFITSPLGEQPGSELVIVLGYAYWMKRFGGDPAVVGRTVQLDGQPARIIGVVPRDFHGLYAGTEMDGYAPIGALRGRTKPYDQIFSDRRERFLTLIGRLQPNVSIAAAQDAINAVAARLGSEYPASDGHTGIRVMPEPLARPVPLKFIGRILPLIKSLLFVLSLLVLAIACMNVTNLMLVRATVREREMAVRAALGSSRAQLIRLLLGESLVLAMAGSVAGLIFGQWAARMLIASIDLGISLPITLDPSPDWKAFLYMAALAIVAGGAVGLLPALRASRASLTDLLHDGSRGDSGGAGRHRVRRGLVIAQVAGSLVLLIVAGLFVRNLRRAELVDLGFDQHHLLNARMDPGQIGYDLPHTGAFYDELVKRLSAIPGVESVGMAFTTPLGFVFGGLPIRLEGEVPAIDRPPASIGFNSVNGTYFDTMRLHVLAGRGIDDRDIATSKRVAVVNETLAARLWPNRSPIGHRFVIPDIDDKLWEVVGVVNNSKYIAVFEDPLPYFYVPITQNPSFWRVISLRSSLPADSLSASVQHEISMLEPAMPSPDIHTMEQSIEGGFGFLLFRVGAMQAAGLGVLGLMLAVVGVYGIVSYGASQRTREIGIRLALGGSPSDVRWLVLRQGATLVAGGIVAGLVVTALVTRAISKLLYMVSATDPITFAIVTAMLGGIALLACYLPARRAMRINPIEALRHE